MRVLVTGSSGLIGGAIMAHLQAVGHQVVGLHAHAGPQGVGPAEVIADVASTADVAGVARDIPACDAVVHAAACLDMGLYSTDVSRINGLGTQLMLWLLSQWSGKAFVFLSSLPVIGLPRALPILETHPTEPRTAYHASKLYGEQLVHLIEEGGVAATSLRITAPVGPSMPDNRILSVFVRRALQGAPLELAGRGGRKQDYVDVRDIARAVGLCLDRQSRGVINVASGHGISNLDLARRCIARLRSSSEIRFTGREDPEEAVDWSVSIAKAATQLGYSPAFMLDDSIDAVALDQARRIQ